MSAVCLDRELRALLAARGLRPAVWANLGLDFVTLASLFVLGGDFWDKVRAVSA
jgi:hypothetical protein